MTISQEAYNKLHFLINKKFPNWEGFEDPRFVKEETGYKRSAVEKAKELLGKTVLEDLIKSKK